MHHLRFATACLAVATLGHADVVAPGYALQTLTYPGREVTATLQDGRIVSFDGLQVLLGSEQPTGGSGQIDPTVVLTEFPSFVFPSFVVVDPTESFCVVGESLNGELYAISLRRGGRKLIATLPLNYDAVFQDEQYLLVSAAIQGFGAGNDIVRLNVANGAFASIGFVPGASGPVALTPTGSLLYATASDSFPAPPGYTDVLSWSAAQVASGVLLTETNASVLASGFEAGSDLAVDPVSGDVYLAENDFGSGRNRILRVRTGPNDSDVLVEGTTYRTMRNLELVPGTGGGRLKAFQPKSHGGLLRYNTTDFFTSWERIAIRTRRPVATATGPGATTGLGPFTYTVTGAQPNGTVVLLWAPSSLLVLPEIAYFQGGPGDPLFLGVAPDSLVAISMTNVSLDASGSGSASFSNPVGVPGAVVLYGVVGEVNVLGVTTRIVL